MSGLGNLKAINLPMETIVMLALFLVLGIYAVFSAILYYHWKTYGTDNRVTGLTLILYFATTVPLLVIMTIAALII